MTYEENKAALIKRRNTDSRTRDDITRFVFWMCEHRPLHTKPGPLPITIQLGLLQDVYDIA